MWTELFVNVYQRVSLKKQYKKPLYRSCVHIHIRVLYTCTRVPWHMVAITDAHTTSQACLKTKHTKLSTCPSPIMKYRINFLLPTKIDLETPYVTRVKPN